MLIFPLLFRRNFLLETFELLGRLNLRVQRCSEPSALLALRLLNLVHILSMSRHLLADFSEFVGKVFVHKSKRVATTPNVES